MSAFVFPLDSRDPVGFALAYPFARPAGSFVFVPGRDEEAAAADVTVARIAQGEAAGLRVPLVSVAATFDGERRDFGACVPVLASGSNAAPAQLARKFADEPAAAPILVHAVTVEGIASVYSAHVARYGSVAATLLPCAGVLAELHLLFVPPARLARLNASESIGGNYLLAALDGHPARIGGHEVRPLAYVSRRGPARFAGQARRLPGTGGAAAPFATEDQAAIQRHLMAMMGERGELSAFVARLIADDGFRASATRRLAEATQRVIPDGARVLAGA